METEQLDSLRILVVVEDTAPFGSSLLGQHGLALFVEARRRNAVKRLALDVGQNYSTLRHNMLLLGIEPAQLDAIVLTHCHYDHTTGLSSLLADTAKKELPVVAHPETFRPNFVLEPSLRHVGMSKDDLPTNISSSGGRLFLTRDSIPIMPGLFTTGEVPRVTDFEDTGIVLYTIDSEGNVTLDTMPDDISLVADIRGRGLVILTGCSHAGIVNIVKHAMDRWPGRKLEGIIGGFHLINASEERIKRTIDYFSEVQPNWVAAGHCTGFKAQFALYSAFGDRFVPLTCGKQFLIEGG